MSDDDEERISLGHARAQWFTDDAVLVFVVDLQKRIWIPLSVIHDDSELYDNAHTEGELVIARWFAEKRGYV